MRRPTREGLRWGATAFSAATAFLLCLFQLHSVPRAEISMNTFFVPPRAVVVQSARGFENITADLLWLSLIQYYGERLVIDHYYLNLKPMFDLITDLDPHFRFAYTFGAWGLADNKEAEQGLALLRKGRAVEPDYYEYPFLAGFIRFLYLKDYMGAAAEFHEASSKPNCPRFSASMEASMYVRGGKQELALAVWQQLYDSAKDRVSRDIARRNLNPLRAKAGLPPVAP